MPWNLSLYWYTQAASNLIGCLKTSSVIAYIWTLRSFYWMTELPSYVTVCLLCTNTSQSDIFSSSNSTLSVVWRWMASSNKSWIPFLAFFIRGRASLLLNMATHCHTTESVLSWLSWNSVSKKVLKFCIEKSAVCITRNRSLLRILFGITPHVCEMTGV